MLSHWIGRLLGRLVDKREGLQRFEVLVQDRADRNNRFSYLEEVETYITPILTQLYKDTI